MPYVEFGVINPISSTKIMIYIIESSLNPNRVFIMSWFSSSVSFMCMLGASVGGLNGIHLTSVRQCLDSI